MEKFKIFFYASFFISNLKKPNFNIKVIYAILIKLIPIKVEKKL